MYSCFYYCSSSATTLGEQSKTSSYANITFIWFPALYLLLCEDKLSACSLGCFHVRLLNMLVVLPPVFSTVSLQICRWFQLGDDIELTKNKYFVFIADNKHLLQYCFRKDVSVSHRLIAFCVMCSQCSSVYLSANKCPLTPAEEYVTCHTCRSPETILQKDTRLYFLQCETCHSRCSVASIKTGFQAVTGKRAQLRAKAN